VKHAITHTVGHILNQKSTRRWNLETHIKRRHGGAGQPIPKLPNVILQSPANNWLDDFKSRYPHNLSSSSNGDPLDLQRNIIEFLRIVTSYLALGLYGKPPMNVGLCSSLPPFLPSSPQVRMEHLWMYVPMTSVLLWGSRDMYAISASISGVNKYLMMKKE
jgi:hypothetical protein